MTTYSNIIILATRLLNIGLPHSNYVHWKIHHKLRYQHITSRYVLYNIIYVTVELTIFLERVPSAAPLVCLAYRPIASPHTLPCVSRAHVLEVNALCVCLDQSIGLSLRFRWTSPYCFCKPEQFHNLL